jgi:hypothetical protein
MILVNIPSKIKLSLYEEATQKAFGPGDRCDAIETLIDSYREKLCFLDQTVHTVSWEATP